MPVVIRSTLLAAALAATVAGCSSYQSSYRRSRGAPSELIWAYHDRFQITQDGKIVAEQHDWDALSGVVACVPQARAWAETAASRDRIGTALLWSGIGAIATGLAIGITLVLAHPHDNGPLVVGGIAALGGIVGGMPLALTGSVMRDRADATAIDAVNLYNDERAGCAAHP